MSEGALGPRHPKVLEWLPHRRRKAGLALVEGERVVAEALAGAMRIEALLVAADLDPEQIRKYQNIALQSDWQVYRLNSAALRKLADTESPPPVAVIVRPFDYQLGDWLVWPERLLVLDRLADPGNVGTLLRTAVAFDWTVVLTEGSVRRTNEKLLRATAGMSFHHGMLFEGGPAEELADRLDSKGYQVVTLEVGGTNWLHEAAPLSGPVALVLGSEAHGVSGSWPTAVSYRIKTDPSVESLNVAISGAIAMHHFSVIAR